MLTFFVGSDTILVVSTICVDTSTTSSWKESIITSIVSDSHWKTEKQFFYGEIVRKVSTGRHELLKFQQMTQYIEYYYILTRMCDILTFNKRTYTLFSSRSYRIQLYLEIGLLQLHYYQYKQANENFEAAFSVSEITCHLDGETTLTCLASPGIGLKWIFSGALGVRTKFQQKPVAQLRAQIDRKGDEMKSFTPKFAPADIPKVNSSWSLVIWCFICKA